MTIKTKTNKNLK